MSALTYASQEDFISMKEISKSGVTATKETTLEKIDYYLQAATRYIRRYTLRDFIPWVEEREYPVPYRFQDLRLRRFPYAELELDQDLLEIIQINNGDTEYKPEDPTDYYLLHHNIYPKSIVVLQYPFAWGAGRWASRASQPVIFIKAVWGYADFRYPSEYWIDTNETLISAIDATQTTITVNDAEGLDVWGNRRFATPSLIKIDDEFIAVTSMNKTTNVLNLVRGDRGTTAATHTLGTKIYRWRVIEDIRQATLQIAKTWREADLAAGGRLGVSDLSATVEISIPTDPARTVQMYRRA